jgi:hypothetical protein
MGKHEKAETKESERRVRYSVWASVGSCGGWQEYMLHNNIGDYIFVFAAQLTRYCCWW